MTNSTEWHGWKKGRVTVHVGPLPGRKTIALYSAIGSVIHTHAYFRNETEASIFLAVLGYMAAGEVTALLEKLLKEYASAQEQAVDSGSSQQAGGVGLEPGADVSGEPEREADERGGEADA